MRYPHVSRFLLAGLALVVVAVGVIGVATLLVRSQTEWSSETGVQIAARRLDDGRVEFGLRQRVGDEWSELSLPAQRYLLEDAPIDEWLLSDELQVTGTSVQIRLRDGVYAGDWPDEFLIYLDDEVYETNCGRLELRILKGNILIDTMSSDCTEWKGLATACGGDASECDKQQAMVYSWEWAQMENYQFDRIELSLADAEAVVQAVYADYVASATVPAVRRHLGSVVSYYSQSDNTIYLSDWGADLDTVLHETAHAIIHRRSLQGDGHDSHYAAQILDLWRRYAPLVDVVGARRAAFEYGVEVASTPPVKAFSDDGVEALWVALCADLPRPESYCNALSGSLRSLPRGSSVQSSSAPVIADGEFGETGRYWTSIAENGRLETGLRIDTKIVEQPEHLARLRVKCDYDELDIDVWWQIERSFTGLALVNFTGEEVERQVWKKSTGRWSIDGVRTEFRISDPPNDDDFLKSLAWASVSGQDFTIQIKSGAKPFTATFDLDGLFTTPVQPNIARCGRDAD